ncbi:terminase large subunit [Cetobacterium somerae]|uniref:terminase large subunit n=1 Tax=Cetobacterium somerae TaxID=188913 RepID=UPI0022535EC5|nr:terminase TerL endonuclease subunit [Cetobacterium somerae]MCX3068434.1 terminase large subunit [Cetobacterium somerae]
MSIKEELIKYSRECIEDIIPSGQKHIWACKRFLKDIEENQFIWDEIEAQRIVKWFTYLRHSKGILAGTPIELTVWQKFIVCQIYAWKRENGYRRFKKAFIEVGRKNAKTQMQAGCMLYEISTVATRNNEIAETFCAGTKREQSKLLFSECQNMLIGSPLSPKFKLTRDKIVHIKTTSFLKPLSKQDGKTGDGTNPAALVLDEYHQHTTTEFYDLALGSNSKESLLLIITTAGVDLNVPCYTEEYKYCSELLNPDMDIDNVEYFVDICEADKDDDIGDIRTWKKANPLRATYKEGIDKIASDYEVAKSIPEKMISFKTKILNIWVQAKDLGYMDMEKWKRCEVKKLPFDILNRPVYVGFDMSAKIDLTSVAFIIPIMIDEVTKYVVFSHSFIPNRDKLMERKLIDKVPYDSWEERGFLTVTNTPIVDQEQVMNYVLRVCEENKWNIRHLCFDPANASKLMMDLENQGYEVTEVYQSHKSLNESTAGFREQVYSENVYYLPNPLLNYAMGNTVIRQNNGLIKIDKDASIRRIDPIDALLCGFKLAMYHEFELDMNKYASDEYLDRLYGGGE